ncbi:hypothetical protein [Flavivirga jejuensis]|uniref:Subunit length determinant protein n=1 Tax=Flavivirga jejuensis TaxID=870487 RepID=A0ABT8WQD8_9FLAO|nr:hypothetical protein [Flavivirga jejuensis]MDO5975353.1 hypothetical protein [Flavivirga jejuensis]
MSKDLPQPQQSEEVDLGQLFKLIGNAFSNLFHSIGRLFNKLFLAFVWLVFFVKTHVLKLIIAGIVGVVLGIVLEKTSEAVYKSSITLKQNYDTGENLYNEINYYKNLIKQEDISTLENILGIKSDEAESILDFEIEPVISENEKLQEFDAYLKEIDTSLLETIEYKTFLNNSKDHDHQYQKITIKAEERKNFKKVFHKIITNINSNVYFKREQEKDLIELRERASAITKSLIKADTLLAVYQKAIVKSAENNNDFQGKINITTDKGRESSTKEFELYNKGLELRASLIEIEREIADKEYIIEITSSKQDSGTIDDKKELFDVMISPKRYYAIILIGLTFITLLSLRFVKFLERYKDKI